MSSQLICPKCKLKLTVVKAGGRAKCPGCGQMLLVPKSDNNKGGKFIAVAMVIVAILFTMYFFILKTPVAREKISLEIILPQSPLFVVSFPNPAAALKAFSTTNLARLGAEKDMQEFFWSAASSIMTVSNSLQKFINAISTESGHFRQLPAVDARDVIDRRLREFEKKTGVTIIEMIKALDGEVAVAAVECPGGKSPLGVMMTAFVGENEVAADKLLRSLTEKMGKSRTYDLQGISITEVDKLCYAIVDSVIVASSDRNLLEHALIRVQNFAHDNKQNPKLMHVRKQVCRGIPVGYCFLDLEKFCFMDMLENRFKTYLAQSGIASCKSAGYGVNLVDGHIQQLLYVYAPSPRSGVLSLIDKPANLALMRYIPQEAGAIEIGGIDLANTIRELKRFYALQKKDKTLFWEVIANVEREMATNVEKLFACLEPGYCTFINTADRIVVCEIADEPQLRKYLNRLTSSLVRKIKGEFFTFQLRKFPPREFWKNWPYSGAFYIEQGKLWYSPSLNDLSRYIMRWKSGKLKFDPRRNPEIADFITSVDTSSIIAYGHHGRLLSGYRHMLRNFFARVASRPFPIRTWTQHSQNDANWVRTNTTGVTWHGRGLSLNSALWCLSLHARFSEIAAKRLTEEMAAIKQTGGITDFTQIGPTYVADRNNAAHWYNMAINRCKMNFDETTAIENFLDAPDKNRRLLVRVRKVVEQNHHVLDLVLKASLQKKCNFGIDYSKGVATELPQLGSLHKIGKLIRMAIYLESTTGNHRRAVKLTGAYLRMTRHIESDPFLICHLVHIAMHGALVDTLALICEEFSALPKDYVQLIPEFKDNFLGYLKQSMISERAMGFGLFTVFEKEFAATPLAPLLQMDKAVYCSMLKRFIAIAHTPYHQLSIDLNLIDAELKKVPMYYLITTLMVPALNSIYAKTNSAIAKSRIAQVGIILKLYKYKTGYYPASLSQMIPQHLLQNFKDPFTGKDLIYRRERKGFVLYSLGADTIDHGGKFDGPANKRDIGWRLKK